MLRHPSKGGPLKPILSRIAARLSKATGKEIGETEVLLLWTIGTGAIAVTASGNEKNIKKMGELFSAFGENGIEGLTKEEIEEITEVGKKVHFRHYVSRFVCPV